MLSSKRFIEKNPAEDIMKRILYVLSILVLLLSLFGCTGSTPTENNNPQDLNKASKWFDCLHGDEMKWDDTREIKLDAYPGVTFRCSSEKIEAVTEEETLELVYGMPVWNVYFCDLTGDGKPELCSTISFGSGMIDTRIIVYDYTEKTSYELSDRGNFDYALQMRDGSLIGEKRVYLKDELLESGELVFQNDTIQIKAEE
jgi:hypothetical protein